MTDPTDFMRRAAQEPDAGAPPPEIPTDRPTSARVYGLFLGSKDNFEVDRQAAALALEMLPETLDVARQNRQFLYRAVRHLARDEGIDQFLDLGSGLPSDRNVHQVAQEFQPQARVVYADNDPIVLAHGRALLAEDDSTTVIQADITDPQAVLNTPEAREVLDLSRPVGVLLFAILHNIPDPDDVVARRVVRGYTDAVASGSFLALSHWVADDPASLEEGNRLFSHGGHISGTMRSPAGVDELLEGLRPVEPGLCDINDWRPDPDQPPLPEPHPMVQPYLGVARDHSRSFVYGGVLRKP